MNRDLRVGLAWQMDRRYGEEIIRGIAEYSERYGPWQFFMNQIADFDVCRGEARRDLDGIIICHDEPQRIQSIAWPKQVPIIAMQRTLDAIAPWQVLADNVAIGRLAAEEFLRRGFRHLAYCPQSDLRQATIMNWEQDRVDGFSAIAHKAGAQVLVYHGPVAAWGHLEYKTHSLPLARWLAELPKPVAIMAANDLCARHLLLAAEAAAVRLPDEVAVIGVDNEAWAQVLFRGLSSIEPDGFRAGYAAAELLHRLTQKNTVKPAVLRIPPLRLITRRSSSTMALDDADVVRAVRYIAERATTGIGVRDVVEAVPLSRRTLERRFHRLLGRSVLQEIHGVQMQRAKLLLADESIPLAKVARVSGFGTTKHFRAVFRRLTGQSPMSFRASITFPPRRLPMAGRRIGTGG